MVLTPPWETKAVTAARGSDDVEPERNQRTAGVLPRPRILKFRAALEAINYQSVLRCPAQVTP